MNIRQAILKAADSIETQPDLFDFHSVAVPECGTPGCAIGWIVAHSGVEVPYTEGRHGRARYWSRNHKDRELLGLDDSGVFYDRMNSFGNTYWQEKAQTTATALRLYADKFHPETCQPETDHIPASVREIFSERSNIQSAA